WKQLIKNGKISYKIDREHPLVRRALQVPGPLQPAISTLLRVIEETVPMHAIWLDEAKQGENVAQPFAGASEQEIARVAEQIYLALRDQNYSPEAARHRLQQSEFICDYPHIIAALKD